jgi:tRNA A-37 threonylcarbamoyl transferase component Bud32
VDAPRSRYGWRVTIPTPRAGAAEGAGAPEEAPTRLPPGALVADRYRVVSFLDEGGMGAVYRVEHQHMRKAFALKVLHRTLVDRPEIVARFEREAVAAGSIGHPNVAAATDFGRLPDGSFFLILELVRGRNLRDELRDGALTPDRASRIVRGIVAGVGAAHAKGIVHRDLKPENIMLVEHEANPDFVKVLDFGIAKLEPGAPTGADGVPAALTRMGAVIGTLEYMAPEQALGNPVDARSDLYSIGVIFYELLSGRCPFEGDAVRLLQQHLLGDVPELPVGVASKLDPRMVSIVRRLLAKHPGERFATAIDLGAALRELAAPARVVVLPAQRPMPLPVRDRLRGFANALVKAPLAVRVGVLTLLALAAIAFALHRGGDRPPPAAARPSTAAVPTASFPLALPPAPTPTDSPATPPQRRNPEEGAAAGAAAHRRTGPGGLYIPPPRDWFK